MDLFRYFADLLHVVAMGILVQRILSSRNSYGLSYKTQEIYMVVFLVRYMDLFMYFISLYNTLMKLAFIGITAYTIYLMRFKRPFNSGFGNLGDNFKHYLLYPAAFVLALIFHHHFTLWGIAYCFALWLEALAIIPQLWMLFHQKHVENITTKYILTLGGYRFFYLMSWIYRLMASIPIIWVSLLAGLVQTGLYGTFVYYFLKRQERRDSSTKEGSNFITLPV